MRRVFGETSKQVFPREISENIREILSWSKIYSGFLNPRTAFAVQIHCEGKVDPISYDKIYIKTQRRNYY